MNFHHMNPAALSIRFPEQCTKGSLVLEMKTGNQVLHVTQPRVLHQPPGTTSPNNQTQPPGSPLPHSVVLPPKKQKMVRESFHMIQYLPLQPGQNILNLDNPLHAAFGSTHNQLWKAHPCVEWRWSSAWLYSSEQTTKGSSWMEILWPPQQTPTSQNNNLQEPANPEGHHRSPWSYLLLCQPGGSELGGRIQHQHLNY